MTIYLLEQHADLVHFIEQEIGAVFDETPANVRSMAEHMGWTTSEVRAALRLMRRRGVMQHSAVGPVRKRWQLNLSAVEAA